MATSEQLAKLNNYTQLVHRIVGGFQKRLPKNVLREDLMAAGMSGLWSALQRHTGSDEHFEWYVRVKIRGAILDELRSQDWLPRRARWLMAEDAPLSVVHLEDVSAYEKNKALTVEVEVVNKSESNYRSRSLRKAIAHLPEREKLIVTLHDIQGLKLKMIAEQLGISEPRASQIRTRAISQLKTLMAQA
jgi:RNA polymerase sigma factor for flagellar operon FliA